MTMIALAFLHTQRLKQAGGGKKRRPATGTQPSGNQNGHH